MHFIFKQFQDMIIDQSISRNLYQFLVGFYNLVQPNFVAAASPFVFFLFPFCRSFCWWANQTILLRLVHDCNDTTMYCQTIHSLSIIFFFTYASVGTKVILKKSCDGLFLNFKYCEKATKLESIFYFFKECVSMGAAGAQTHRSLGHRLLHPQILSF